MIFLYTGLRKYTSPLQKIIIPFMLREVQMLWINVVTEP